MAGKTIDVTDRDIARMIEQPGATLLDFWSQDCAPCRTLAPVLDDLARDFADELRIGKVDVGGDAALAERFGARSLPTLVLYRDGREVDRVVGARSRSQLTAWLENRL